MSASFTVQVGWVRFSGVRHYTDRQTWAAAQHSHLVPDSDGPYGWMEGALAMPHLFLHTRPYATLALDT